MPEIIGKIKKKAGVADQVAYDLTVQYPDEEPMKTGFVGHTYGRPGVIVMVTPGNPKGSFVRDPERFGDTFDESWVRAFVRES